ncbi:MAG: hypothetical protein EOO52_19470 [Gammaproteobacteria bacterium]|nr:MAG: hypothetical protein EOO52_19470 [Gammaproteobacteria bacterium]
MNENIYEPPKSNVSPDPHTTLSIKGRLVWTVAIIFTAMLYRSINKIAPQFAETFASFGTELSLITQFFVKAYPVFYWLGIASLFPISFWLINLFNEKYALRLIKIGKYNLWLSLLCFALFMISVYLPVFSMSKVN